MLQFTSERYRERQGFYLPLPFSFVTVRSPSTQSTNFTMNLVSLTHEKMEIARKIGSAYAFYYEVADALVNRKPLSVVRMGDGEHTLITEVLNNYDLDVPLTSYDEAWHKRMGTHGLTRRELYRRLMEAGNQCTHFAPSVSGLVLNCFDLFGYFYERDHYVDNFFVNIWSDEHKIALYKEAGSILFIHRNRATADAIQKRCKQYLGVRLRYLELSNWDQSDSIIEQARADDAPLVLFAGGPASKYISPRIAAQNKVVLDLGNSTDQWTLLNLTKNPPP